MHAAVAAAHVPSHRRRVGYLAAGGSRGASCRAQDGGVAARLAAGAAHTSNAADRGVCADGAAGTGAVEESAAFDAVLERGRVERLGRRRGICAAGVAAAFEGSVGGVVATAR